MYLGRDLRQNRTMSPIPGSTIRASNRDPLWVRERESRADIVDGYARAWAARRRDDRRAADRRPRLRPVVAAART